MNIETDSAYIAELRARCERAEAERDSLVLDLQREMIAGDVAGCRAGV